jgi:hypothetical protein
MRLVAKAFTSGRERRIARLERAGGNRWIAKRAANTSSTFTAINRRVAPQAELARSERLL